MRRLLFVLTGMCIAATTLVAVPRLTGADEIAYEHCAVQVLGTLDTGEMITSEPVCVFGDDQARADLYAAIGIGGASTNVALAASGSDVRVTELSAAAAQILGVHYDGVGYGGSSFAVWGSNCLGGYVNLSSSWKNRVSSTINVLCTRIKHHDYVNRGGSYQSTWWSGGNLSYMQNRADSISYTTA